MRRVQISIASLMVVVAGLSIILALGRSRVLPARTAASSRPDLNADRALGFRALRKGRLAEARSRLLSAARSSPSRYEDYFGLGLVAYAAGDYNEAHARYSQAIGLAEAMPGHRGIVADLHRRRAQASLALSRQPGSSAILHCRAALDDLAKGRPAGVNLDPQTLFLIESTSAEAEQRLGDFMAWEGDRKAAAAHHANAKRHAQAALAIRPQPEASRTTPLMNEIVGNK